MAHRLKRWLMAIAVALVAGSGYSGAAVDDLPIVREGNPATVTLRFAHPPRCVGGSTPNALCRSLSDCRGGATGCVADPATPTRVVYELYYAPVHPDRRRISLLAPVTVTPDSDTVTLSWADNPIVVDDHQIERHLLRVTWDPPGGGPSASDEIPFLVRNLATLPDPTATPTPTP